ncbi:hypothetical protein EA772_01465 [Pedobacter sp. G11]|uniref:hypothetical protein n=1 Tax=Pedobacter sp. G11 TaxID=2482728 RepID=UPI000F5D79E5|nr:hypothetical protein [Pedobacter sp. G11]AZI24074.1 hypothetical protein EA772_01465 [Pedobacter sp. G11]
MKCHKLSAYTLMEITVAMLLSAIVISVCYTAYGLIDNYYQTFRLKNESHDQALALRHVLIKDFASHSIIIARNNGIELIGDSMAVGYVFEEDKVIREIKYLHTDTFHLSPSSWMMGFDGQDRIAGDTINELDFFVQIDKGVEIPMNFRRVYSAVQLFK